MDFFRKFFSSSPSMPPSNFYPFAVQCDRCGEVIEGRINLNNDLSLEYEDNRVVYQVHKTLMGSGRCFQRMEVEMKFNESKHLIEKQAQGGQFTDPGRGGKI